VIDQESLQAFLVALAKHPVTDIYVPGYLDRGSGAAERFLPEQQVSWLQFHPVWDAVYLEVGTTLFLLETVDQYWNLWIERAERIECRFSIDPDDAFSVASFRRAVLHDGRDEFRASVVEIFTPADASTDRLMALGLMDADSYLFFDPLDPNGLRVGSKRSRDMWVEYWRGKFLVREIDLQSQ